MTQKDGVLLFEKFLLEGKSETGTLITSLKNTHFFTKMSISKANKKIVLWATYGAAIV